MTDASISMLAHHVGQRVLSARFNLESGDSQGADEDRRSIVGTFSSVEKHPTIDRCIKYLEQ